MRVIAADIIDVTLHPHKPPVILRLITDEGLYGVGEFPLSYGIGRSAALAMLQEMVEQYVIGQDPARVEKIWKDIFFRTFWAQGGGPVVYGGLSTIDMALWDIKGKAANLPVYDLLGGRMRDDLHVYCNGWLGTEFAPAPDHIESPEAYGERAAMVVSMGYDALKFDPFSAPRGSGWGPRERLLEPERGELAYQRVKAVREAVGPQVDVLVEVHGWLGVSDAIAWGRRIVDLKPFFYEEPVDAMNVEVMARVGREVPIPLAAGERLYTRYQFREYIEKQVLDILQPDIGLAGGITELKKIASYAETYNLYMQPHNCHGPIATAAAVQVDACISNFIIQETVPERPMVCYDMVNEPLEPQIRNSRMPIPTGPGLGVTLNEKYIARCNVKRLGDSKATF
ncbi:MAG: mandelate racemase/muconate lactonizing enzyme family protein [Anaerolineae bacterium]|jgi:galactonate dehydratase|nr:mandelate racemase/muconate lactonizing enzyme family protein [Chloroflexota bacterium]